MMSTTFASPSPSPIFASPTSPFKKQKMSVTQTYFLAHKARAKLSHEAAMPDHNLRLLVGHANLLDSLMLELADAEREQESWFNNSVRSASQQDKKTSSPSENRHIQWADTIPEEDEEEVDDEEDYDDSSCDDESDMSDEDVEMADVVSLRRVPSNNNLKAAPSTPKTEVVEIDMDDYEEDDYDDEDYAELTLTRSPSHHATSPPPELEIDSDESSEDEAMPPSPPTTLLPTFADEKQQEEESEEPQDTADFYDDSIQYMPTRSPARLVTAISVY